MCHACWEKKSASPGSAEPWLPKGVPRLTRGNTFGFLFLFAFFFLDVRFHFPFSYHAFSLSTRASALIALLFASIAVYIQGDR
jgi:hypothetical protein